MIGIVMTAALAGASAAPAQCRRWDEINGVYGTYGGYGNFSGCGYASYGCYSGCGPGCGFVYFVDNGCCNFPVPVFVPAPPPPCFYGFCPPPLDFMTGPPILAPDMDPEKDEMLLEKPRKEKTKKKRKPKQEEEDDDDDQEARLWPRIERALLRAETNLRFNHRAALVQAMWRRL